MKKRKLGQDFTVSALGHGCMGMSEFYGPRDDTESMQVLSRAVELGVDFFDTADMYGPHHNEALLGDFIRQTGAEIKIATKFGIRRKPGEYARWIDNSVSYAREACEASLKRLGIDCIDLYYVHRVNTEQPIEETMEGLAALIKEGKIARIGLCEVSSDTLRRAHAVHPVSALQTEYSLWSRQVEDSILPACRALGVGFVPYSPLGRGFLTGRFHSNQDFADQDFRNSMPRFAPETIRQNRRVADVIVTMAAENACTPAQLALAWLLAQGDDIVPIPGTKQLKYLEDNIAAIDVSISTEVCARLEAAVAELPVLGERYTDEGMKGVDA